MRAKKFWALPAGLGMLAVGAVALGPTVASAHGGPAPTPEAKQCLADQGVTPHVKGTKPTEAERAAFEAARAACGLPARGAGHGPKGPNGAPRPHGPRGKRGNAPTAPASPNA